MMKPINSFLEQQEIELFNYFNYFLPLIKL